MNWLYEHENLKERRLVPCVVCGNWKIINSGEKICTHAKTEESMPTEPVQE